MFYFFLFLHFLPKPWSIFVLQCKQVNSNYQLKSDHTKSANFLFTVLLESSSCSCSCCRNRGMVWFHESPIKRKYIAASYCCSVRFWDSKEVLILSIIVFPCFHLFSKHSSKQQWQENSLILCGSTFGTFLSRLQWKHSLCSNLWCFISKLHFAPGNKAIVDEVACVFPLLSVIVLTNYRPSSTGN